MIRETDPVAMHVYVGNYGTYPIPADIVQQALDANAGKRLSDGRTRGARILKTWGRAHDVPAQTRGGE